MGELSRLISCQNYARPIHLNETLGKPKPVQRYNSHIVFTDARKANTIVPRFPSLYCGLWDMGGGPYNAIGSPQLRNYCCTLSNRIFLNLHITGCEKER